MEEVLFVLEGLDLGADDGGAGVEDEDVVDEGLLLPLHLHHGRYIWITLSCSASGNTPANLKSLNLKELGYLL